MAAGRREWKLEEGKKEVRLAIDPVVISRAHRLSHLTDIYAGYRGMVAWNRGTGRTGNDDRRGMGEAAEGRKKAQMKENKKLISLSEFFDPPIVDYIKHYIIGFSLLAIFF
jgi:hypothetical protein